MNDWTPIKDVDRIEREHLIFETITISVVAATTTTTTAICVCMCVFHIDAQNDFFFFCISHIMNFKSIDWHIYRYNKMRANQRTRSTTNMPVALMIREPIENVVVLSRVIDCYQSFWESQWSSEVFTFINRSWFEPLNVIESKSLCKLSKYYVHLYT